MYLIHVYPIARGIGISTLTYFARSRAPKGAIITVPVRGKDTPAVVVSTEQVKNAKARVRSADFPTLRVKALQPRALFLPAFVRAAEHLARETVATPGAVLFLMTPKALLASDATLPKQPRMRGHGTHEVQLLQQSRADRISMYRTIARENFARGNTTLILCPSAQTAAHIKEELARGIPNRVVLLSGDLTPRRQRDMWIETAAREQPVLIIATGAFLGLPRVDIDRIIVENELSSLYHREMRPFSDVRRFAEHYARELGVRCIMADAVLRSATRHRLGREHVVELPPFARTARERVRTTLVDMRPYKRNTVGEYHAISKELRELIQRCERERTSLLIVSGRRGRASSVICGDCGEGLRCLRCGATFSLHGNPAGRRSLLCHRCGSKRDAAVRCRSCDSWKLVALGAGSELLEEHVRALVSNMPVLRLDSDSATTVRASEKIAREFLAAPSILVATEKALQYIQEPLPSIAIASIDSLLSVPHYNIEERVFGLITALRAQARNAFMVQTRMPEHETIRAACAGEIETFQRAELLRRQMFSFPPFATLITITRAGNKQAVEKDMHMLAEELLQYKPIFLPPEGGTVYTRQALLRVREWPNAEIEGRLRALPPSFAIDVRMS